MAETNDTTKITERMRGSIRYLLGSINYFPEVAMFLVLTSCAVVSITEISARGNFLSQLQNQINSINQELVQDKVSSAERPNEKLRSESDFKPSDEIKNKIKNLSYYRDLRARLKALISVGTDEPEQTLAAMRRAFACSLSPPDFPCHSPDSRDGNVQIEYLAWYYVFTWNSDHLLAIAVMTCGAIGASIASIRNTGRLTWHSVLFGLSSGLIIFLAIKGGKNIFLLQVQGQMPQFNPYSSGFLGLIAGMFTERTFGFLGAVTDAVLTKLKKVLEE